MIFDFYADSQIELQVLMRLIEVAEDRGHSVRVSIGQPINGKDADASLSCTDKPVANLRRPSFVMLNGLDQGHSSWPSPWRSLNWSSYDWGLLPGPFWMSLWTRSFLTRQAWTRSGVAVVGWPRADRFVELKEESNPPHSAQIGRLRPTVLYAPSFENDGKQQSVVDALKGKDLRLLIKHWNIDPLRSKFPDYFRWVEQANAASSHEDFVTVVDPGTDLYDLLPSADLLITDQSSTIWDALAAGLPSMAVKDWPMRSHSKISPRALSPSPWVTIHAEKDNVSDGVERALHKDLIHEQVRRRALFFSSLGTASLNTIQTLEAIVSHGRPPQHIPAFKHPSPIRFRNSRQFFSPL